MTKTENEPIQVKILQL